MVERRDRSSGEEASLPIIDDMKLVVLLVPANEASEEEVVRVCSRQLHLSRATLLTLHEAHPMLSMVGPTKRFPLSRVGGISR